MKIQTDPKELYRVVNCLEQGCRYRRTCANHTSAGDFRSEDGFSPELHLRRGQLYCDTIDESPLAESDDLPVSHGKLWHGAVLWEEVVELVEDWSV